MHSPPKPVATIPVQKLRTTVQYLYYCIIIIYIYIYIYIYILFTWVLGVMFAGQKTSTNPTYYVLYMIMIMCITCIISIRYLVLELCKLRSALFTKLLLLHIHIIHTPACQRAVGQTTHFSISVA